MIGFKTVFVNITRGEGIMGRSFIGYGPYKGALERVRKGADLFIYIIRVIFICFYYICMYYLHMCLSPKTP